MLVLIANQIYLILLAIVWENGLNVTLTKDMAPVLKNKKKISNSIGGGVASQKLNILISWQISANLELEFSISIWPRRKLV